MELLAAIESRSSAARLAEPGPTPEHLSRILGAAARAPDHGRLKPWHLLVLDRPTKERFASAAAQAKRARSPLSATSSLPPSATESCVRRRS